MYDPNSRGLWEKRQHEIVARLKAAASIGSVLAA
jgi:hypothetical protein